MLTDSQRKTLAFIRHYVAQHGYAPKLQEIASGIGIQSRGVVHRYVQALIAEGLLKNTSGRHRGLQLVEFSHDTRLPLLGKIAAGQPIEAIPGHDEINLSDFFMGADRFALKVQGESMIDAGILDGDIAIIKQQNNAHNGDIVVALIDNEEATLKTFQRVDQNLIKLIPANKYMQAMIYEAERVQIQGILIGSLRRY
ncbi:MAG: transcriptional repressor LexA [Gammaproteobacteria bacterium]|nr:transcriptional repressor LexA [Gammaproteobacteria bacterium]MCW8909482.1 transcriptional repressor LexA [Gammaproteobacteria bacterium]MCW9003668.1 transcriptional repressor LexA [Gammaproteobacteria bacterium]MCW9055771.1 transcriptional repressor LexA [Gammaproteobacteria bacterium]